MKTNIKPSNVTEIMKFAKGEPSSIIESKFFALMRLFETKGIKIDTVGYEKYNAIELSNGLHVAVWKHIVCGIFRVKILILE